MQLLPSSWLRRLVWQRHTASGELFWLANKMSKGCTRSLVGWSLGRALHPAVCRWRRDWCVPGSHLPGAIWFLQCAHAILPLWQPRWMQLSAFNNHARIQPLYVLACDFNSSSDTISVCAAKMMDWSVLQHCLPSEWMVFGLMAATVKAGTAVHSSTVTNIAPGTFCALNADWSHSCLIPLSVIPSS